jgi:hypothetical protein
MIDERSAPLGIALESSVEHIIYLLPAIGLHL